MNLTMGFDRQGSLITAAPGGEAGPILITGLTRLGPSPNVPLTAPKIAFAMPGHYSTSPETTQ